MAAVAIAAETAESHRRTTTQRACTTPMCALFVGESYMTRRTLCSGGVNDEKDEGMRLHRRGGVCQAQPPSRSAAGPGYNVIRAGQYIILMF